MFTNFKGKTLGSISRLQLRADKSESAGKGSSACACEEPVSLCAPQHWHSWEYLLLLEYPGSETGGDLLANCAGAGCHLGLGLVRKGGGSLGQQRTQPRRSNLPASLRWRPPAAHAAMSVPAYGYEHIDLHSSLSVFSGLGVVFLFSDRNVSPNKFPLLFDFFQLPSHNKKKSFICKILDKLVLFFIYMWRLHKHIFRYIYMYVCNTELSWHEIPFSEVAKSVWPNDSYRNLWFS